jgi:hypothetical protein
MIKDLGKRGVNFCTNELLRQSATLAVKPSELNWITLMPSRRRGFVTCIVLLLANPGQPEADPDFPEF